MKISIFINPDKAIENSSIKEEVEKMALNLGFEIDETNPNVVFACGGDGTLLRAVHHYFDQLDKINFCGANFGHLGFFYDYERTEIKDALIAILNSDVRVTKHKLIKGTIENADDTTETIFAINEIRIENNSKPLYTDVIIDGALFEQFLGTGLTISSSIGSTAYNLTLEGAAVSVDLETLQLTPIQPSTLCKCFKSSLILPINKTIYLKGNLNNVLLGYDHVVKERQSFKAISITSSDVTFNLLNRKGTHCLSKLKKLYN